MNASDAMAGPFDLIVALGRAYVTDGSLFLFVHGLVLVAVVLAFRQILAETQSLQRWVRSDGTDEPVGDSQLAGLYHSFALEASELGARGVTIPLTDYSDRAEQAAEEMETRLNDRVHWFLFVGIAGTLVGLFHFAVKYEPSSELRTSPPAVTSVIPDSAEPGESAGAGVIGNLESYGKALERVQNTPVALAQAMKLAFPVGFMGLALTVVGQLFSGIAERRLHSSLSEANHVALRVRLKTVKSSGDFVERVSDALRDAVQPLAAMGEHVSAAMSTALEAQLGDLQRLTAEQMLEVQRVLADRILEVRESTLSVEEASRRFYEHISALSTAIGDLPAILASAPAVLRQTIELQEFQRSQLEKLGRELYADLEAAATLLDKVEEAIEAFGQVPRVVGERAAAGLSEHLKSVGTVVTAEWTDSLSAAREKFEGELFARQRAISTGLNNEAVAVSRMLGETGAGIRALTAEMNALQQRLRSTADDLKKPVVDAVEAASARLNVTLRPLSPMLTEFNESVGRAAMSVSHLAGQTEAAFVSPIRQIAGEMQAAILPFIHEQQALLLRNEKAHRDVTESLGVLREAMASFGRSVGAVQESLDRWRTEDVRGTLARHGSESSQELAGSIASLNASIRELIQSSPQKAHQKVSAPPKPRKWTSFFKPNTWW
jgi:hypothetical protein